MTRMQKDRTGIRLILVAIACLVVFSPLALTVQAESAPGSNALSQNSENAKPDFWLFASPEYSSVAPGSSINSKVIVVSLDKFNGTITLQATFPSGWPISIPKPGSLDLKYDKYNSSDLQIAVPSNALPGQYEIEVTGSNGSLSHSNKLVLNVVEPDFYMCASPSCFSVLAGSTETATIRVIPFERFNGTIKLTLTYPSGWTGTNLALTTLKVTYNSSNSTKLSIVTPSDTTPGRYKISVAGASGSLTHWANVTVEVLKPDFCIYAYASQYAIPAGSSEDAMIKVASQERFNGTIALSATFPTGWTASAPNPSSLTLKYCGYNESKLSIAVPSDATPGKYTITVKGASDKLEHSANVTVVVLKPDFSIYGCTPQIAIPVGSSENAIIKVGSLDRFNGTVALSASFPSGWISSSPNPSSVMIKYNRYNQSLLSIAVPSNAAAGKYTVKVTGVSGALTHSANVTVVVLKPDFSVYASSSFMYLSAGQNGTAIIRLLSLGKFNGTVSLSASFPSGWTSSALAKTSLTVSNNGINSTAITIVVPKGTAEGKYSVTVTGTSGLSTHSITLYLMVKP